MPFSATVFNVLIASPSDVPEERAAIAQSLHEWNSLHSQHQGKILLPVMWETHSVPAMGARPQALINDRVVRGADILIGAFWTRLGSPTGIEDSGTVEEIKWFLANKKPVMLYYCKKPIDPDIIDLEQYANLKAFKSSIRDNGIQEDYRSADELREKLSRHLTIVMRDMSVGPVIDKRIVQAARASTREQPEEEIHETINLIDDLVEGPIWLEDYSEKAFYVRGDSSAFKDKLKDAGGKWIPAKTGAKGWMFSKRHLNEVRKIVKYKGELRSLAAI